MNQDLIQRCGLVGKEKKREKSSVPNRDDLIDPIYNNSLPCALLQRVHGMYWMVHHSVPFPLIGLYEEVYHRGLHARSVAHIKSAAPYGYEIKAMRIFKPGQKGERKRNNKEKKKREKSRAQNHYPLVVYFFFQNGLLMVHCTESCTSPHRTFFSSSIVVYCTFGDVFPTFTL